MNRILLLDSLTRDDVDDAAAQGGWCLLNILPATDHHPAQRIFITPDRQHFIYVVDDKRLGSPYAVVQGANPSKWEDDVRARLPTPIDSTESKDPHA